MTRWPRYRPHASLRAGSLQAGPPRSRDLRADSTSRTLRGRTDALVRLGRERGVGPWSVGVVSLAGPRPLRRRARRRPGLVKLLASLRGRWPEAGRLRSSSRRTRSGRGSRASSSCRDSSAASSPARARTGARLRARERTPDARLDSADGRQPQIAMLGAGRIGESLDLRAPVLRLARAVRGRRQRRGARSASPSCASATASTRRSRTTTRPPAPRSSSSP